MCTGWIRHVLLSLGAVLFIPPAIALKPCVHSTLLHWLLSSDFQISIFVFFTSHRFYSQNKICVAFLRLISIMTRNFSWDSEWQRHFWTLLKCFDLYISSEFMIGLMLKMRWNSSSNANFMSRRNTHAISTKNLNLIQWRSGKKQNIIKTHKQKKSVACLFYLLLKMILWEKFPGNQESQSISLFSFEWRSQWNKMN